MLRTKRADVALYAMRKLLVGQIGLGNEGVGPGTFVPDVCVWTIRQANREPGVQRTIAGKDPAVRGKQRPRLGPTIDRFLTAYLPIDANSS